MTYRFDPRLFIENGPTALAARAHRSHDALRYALAAAAASPPRAAGPAPACPAL
jgi:hypothetical protein